MVFENYQVSNAEVKALLSYEFRRLLLHLTNSLKNDNQREPFERSWGSFIPFGAGHPAVRRIGNKWVFDL